MSKIDMNNLGLDQRIETESGAYPGMYAGRVVAQYKDVYKVVTEKGECTAEISGKMRFEIRTLSEFPAVGDFVMLDRNDDVSGNGIIHHVLTRKTAFVRKAAGKSHDEQIVASNIDKVFICMSLNNDFNLRRLERYLSIAWDSRAVPVVVLTKADLCEDLSGKVAETEAVACGVDVVVTSSLREDGVSPVMAYTGYGQTVGVIGSSGVGKSTLINRLISQNLLETNEIRRDDRGRHTTTTRELIVIPGGGCVIDTPGMRELGLFGADLSKSFADIDELSTTCKFHDCTHTKEPGCAVKKAITDGMLSEERLNSYVNLSSLK